MILIYPASETAFTGSGYGTLADAVSCSVEEELNGAYLLEMDYPLNGVNVDKLVLRNIILCKPNPYDTPDAFRIVDISKELGGMVRVRAQHVSYDMHGIPIAPYNALNITDALTGLTVYAQTAQPFTFITTRSVASAFSVTAPASCRELLGGKQGSLIDTYGGEWSFSRFTARLWLHRGQDRGVQIRYGKNMTSLAEDQEGDVYTGVYPYWKDDDGNLVTCGVVNATGTFNFTKILTMDFSDRFETQPTSAQLQSAAQTYINNSTHIAPSVSLRVSFVDLAQTEEYKHLASETIKLGDTLGIVYAELGITASAKVNKTVYDVLLDRYTAIELGKAKRTLAETIAENAEILTEDGKVNYAEDFFGKSTNLTVSGQLEGETYAMAFGNIYTFGPTFRAENSNTTRHAAEFWMIEPEMAFADLDDLLRVEEDMLKYIISYVLEHAPEEMDFFNQWVEKGVIEKLQKMLSNDFVKLDYTDAIEILKNAAAAGKDFKYPVEWGCDLQTEHEKYLTDEHFGRPVFVVNYPAAIKSFYMKQNPDGKTVATTDLLVPGIGEIIGGSQREERLDYLDKRMDELGLEKEAYDFYLDLRKYGSARHAGFGLGFERCVMYLTGIGNIRDAIPFPRTVGNCEL